MAFSHLHPFLLRLARLVLMAPIARYVADIIFPRIPKQSWLQPSSSAEDGLRVIACGFCRSGTTSLKEALGRLGFPCYHALQFFNIPGQAKLWWETETEGKNNWQQILQGYGAITDFPAALYYKQLTVQYPNAKIVLNVRDPEQWHWSCMNTLIWLNNRLFTQIFISETQRKYVDRVLLGKRFEGRFLDKEFAINVYKSHVEEVKRSVPKEKLLVYEVKEGWAPLCEFLQVDVPNMPFPRANDTGSFRQENQKRARRYFMTSAVLAGLMSVAIAFLLNGASQFFVDRHFCFSSAIADSL